ncbi:zinc finger BED domain-containing protein RICESLEEPER 1-like isoform X1 [Juglans microcarpa x Juglans regia]|uniref:zinc finger BED domain-containing protein RICESLEEPER 1-like isoform X1 n=1 Tax=Juglans microcarpa x Juglans regia TaxID=2249226 RepID=UPI001B7E8EC0|nr:zinc finger BED domain-containing protein RICESLEEPER 1-like isoform X1 [Juglans microcarpa x Juglans regia]XP_040987030.1 zinc finger BED domain-containing protein RICESLEEPER 1-like isoform X1 [Juglans microcarpa x Juglans regia]XP_040987031.1 zinc finger BED domain-containing protein RICESLEEPER 1-like isoform X1 [Juglans microcarpa x Juglans regia]
MEISNDLAGKKPKRLTSVVWNHFEKVGKAESCYAICIHCNKKLSGSSNSGTTHLRNHLMRCLKRSSTIDVSQLLAAKRKKDTTISTANVSFDEGQIKDDNIKPRILKFDQDQKKDEIINLGSSKFDQERSQIDLARMIILHGYPLAMVDHVGFKVFVKNLQPMFEVVPNSAVEKAFVEIYEKEKLKVYETINKLHGRINLCVEMWSSHENIEYLCLTAHYIDEDWKLQKKILNFVTLDSSHTEDMLPEVINKCVMDWDVDHKLFALTFDDCSTDDEIVLRLKEQISHKRPLLSNGQLFGVRSAAHVINLIVLEAMEALREVIQKIRASVKYVRSSQVTQGKFNEVAQQVGISSKKNLLLDRPFQWNSTYIMLETVLEYRGAFSLLQDHDPAYASALTDTEWEWASSVTGYMKLFVEIINVFSSNKCPTANMYFPEICDVHIQLIEWCKSPDNCLSSMALKMKAKFDKYWSKCSFALAAAAILDPRFKMKLVEYYYSLIYGSAALDRIKEVSDGIRELFNAYSICSTMIDQDSALPGSSLPSTSNDTRDRLRGFDKFLHKTSLSQNEISDLDKYLEEPVFPRSCDFNILNWWKVHMPMYPILSMMARDVLGTSMSTVALESTFSTGGRVLDDCRSSLNADTLQALICTRDWLRIESRGCLSPIQKIVHEERTELGPVILWQKDHSNKITGNLYLDCI